MLLKYLILLSVVLTGFQCASYKKPVNLLSFMESAPDLVIATHKLKMEARELLHDESDTVEIKDFRINFTDYKDSVVYIGFIDAKITSDFTPTDSLQFNIKEMTSSFKPYSSDENYFRGTYWARINFNYIRDGESYSDFSLLKLPIEKKD